MGFIKKKKQQKEEEAVKRFLLSRWADRNSDKNNPKIREMRTRWYNQAIKEGFSWVKKLIPNDGKFGEDVWRWSRDAPPGDIQEYCENQEIDFCLNRLKEIEKELGFPYPLCPPIRRPGEQDGRET